MKDATDKKETATTFNVKSVNCPFQFFFKKSINKGSKDSEFSNSNEFKDENYEWKKMLQPSLSNH
jgi:hypothetical protein